MQEKIVKNNENLFTRKCYELSNDMFLQIEKYEDKVNYIQWSIATFSAFSTSGTFFFPSFTENAREVAIDLAEPYPNSFFPSLNFWI